MKLADLEEDLQQEMARRLMKARNCSDDDEEGEKNHSAVDDDSKKEDWTKDAVMVEFNRGI